MVDTLNITRELASYEGETRLDHLWSIIIAGQRVAELWVEAATGEILNVWTHENHRENGYATALYRQAASETAVYHAPAGHRADDGDRFAYRVGGPSCCEGI